MFNFIQFRGCAMSINDAKLDGGRGSTVLATHHVRNVGGKIASESVT